MAQKRSDTPARPKNLLGLAVRARSLGAPQGLLLVGGRVFRCALGRGGRQARKREGDGATPIGVWRLRRVLYRCDQTLRPRTAGLPVSIIGRADGWCDACGDRNYNRAVRLPYSASAERLWREDRVYDVVAVLDHNERPRRRGGGSAIFMHVARAGLTPTEGCIALRLADLKQVLALAGRRTRVHVLS